jgi:hypothetical protein
LGGRIIAVLKRLPRSLDPNVRHIRPFAGADTVTYVYGVIKVGKQGSLAKSDLESLPIAAVSGRGE